MFRSSVSGFRRDANKVVGVFAFATVFALKLEGEHGRKRQCTQLEAQRNSPENKNLPAPIPPIRILRPNPNLEIAYDTRTRNPIYVMEKLASNASTGKGGRKRPRFYEEPLLEQIYRSRQSHYKYSGYDRGHLAAAANYSDPEELHHTFSLANVSPQDHRLNIGLWNILEHWVRKVARRHNNQNENVYVVTGPLWLPSRQTGEQEFQFSHRAMGIPPQLVSIPTHFFKVVVVADDVANTINQCACFVIPNADIDAKKYDLLDFCVSIVDLEIVSGLIFFDGYKEDWKSMAHAVTVTLPNYKGPLLLTDGKGNALLPVAPKKVQKIARQSSLQHLCRDGSCERRR